MAEAVDGRDELTAAGIVLQQSNDLQFKAINSAIEDIRSKLGFRETFNIAGEESKQHRFPNYLFLGGVLAQGLVPLSKRCKLICATHMSRRL